jgi:hypothetical protein
VFTVAAVGSFCDVEANNGVVADPVAYNVATVAEKLHTLLVPTYWVGRDLMAAALQTAPPAALTAQDILLPLDALLFLLPGQSLISPTGHDSSWLAVARAPLKQSQEVGILFATGSIVQDCFYTAVLRPGDTLGSLEYADTQSFSPMCGPYGSISDGDREFLGRMARVGVTLIMLMSSRPNLVETDTPHTAPIPTTGKAARKLAAPNWVGRTYRIVRPEPGNGSHASPYVHWRRGHWRHQAHGEGRALRKDIWIEPMLVGTNNHNTPTHEPAQ